MEIILDKLWGVLLMISTALLGIFVHNQRKHAEEVAALSKELAAYKKDMAEDMAGLEIKLSQRLADYAVDLSSVKTSIQYMNLNVAEIKRSIEHIAKALKDDRKE